jgi:hypothetical protein
MSDGVRPKSVYCGLHADGHGITMVGRIVLDGWLFGLIPEKEDCKGWDMGRMQLLMNQVEARWDEYDNLPSRLPPELLERHTRIYDWATDRARNRGWDPELGDEE